MHLLIGLAGIVLILAIAFALSSNRRAIRPRVVGAAFLLQAGIALLVLYVPAGRAIIAGMSRGVSNLLGYAQAGTDFGARIACSCHYVEGRDIDQCRADFEPGMSMVRLSLDEDAQTVTAAVPMLASTRARYREGWGCVLEPWTGQVDAKVSSIQPPPITRSPA